MKAKKNLYPKPFNRLTLLCFLSLLLCLNSSALAGENVEWEEPRFRGPRPADVVFKVEPLSDSYSVGEPVKAEVTIEVIGDAKPYYMDVDYVGWSGLHFKAFMFDEQGEPLPATEYAMKVEGSPSPLLSGKRGYRPGALRGKYISEESLNRYVVIDRPGIFRLVCFRNWTFWEDDFSVSDIRPVRIVDDGDSVTDEEGKEHHHSENTWGTWYRGVEIAVRPQKKPYVFGRDVMLDVLARNSGTNTVEIMKTGVDFRDFRVMLFDQNGKYLFPKKWQSDRPPAAFYVGSLSKRAWNDLHPEREVDTILEPGEETSYSIRLGNWYEIESPGVYYVLVARRIRLWNLGFPVSNLARIEIIDPDPEE